jgi:hypothetical protein
MRKILIALTVLFAAAGLALPAAAAHAQSGLQFCDTGPGDALNAWSGGPQINVYGCNYVDNNFFTVIQNASNSNYWNIEDTGGGFYDGYCIGDLGNSPSVTRAGLVGGCGGQTIGWGGNFGDRLCDNNNGLEFYNVHHNGWLVPNGNNAGDQFDLNGAEPVCFVFGDI